MSFDSRERLEAISALQAVIGRHDILRTAVMWEGLREPVQVVWRRAELAVEEVEWMRRRGSSGAVVCAVQSAAIPDRCAAGAAAAGVIARGQENERWLMMQLLHHLVGDHTTLEVMQEEIEAHLLGQAGTLPEPLPFRNLVAQARLGVSGEEHEKFFRQLLGDVEEPTAPFGLLDVRGDGTGIEEARIEAGRRVWRGGFGSRRGGWG